MATYYVSPTGSDSANGAQATPWLTFDKVVTQINAAAIVGGDEVVFADDATFTVTAQKTISGGGAADNPITLRSATRRGAMIEWTNQTDNTHLWLSGLNAAHLNFYQLRMKSPRQLNPVLNTINADWLIRCEPVGGGAHHIVLDDCDLEATGIFKNTGRNDETATANWGEGTEIKNCDMTASGAFIDLINVYAARIHHNTMVFEDVSTSSLALQTKGGCRAPHVYLNVLRLTGDQAQYGLMLGGGSEWNGTVPSYIFSDEGPECDYGALVNNIVLIENGGRFSAGALPLVGARNSVVANNVIIGSGLGNGIRMERAYWDGWTTTDGYINCTNPTLLNNIVTNVATAISTGTGVDGTIVQEGNMAPVAGATSRDVALDLARNLMQAVWR